MISPDGKWQWDGAQWVPYSSGVATAPLSARSMLTMAGGAVALVGAAVLLVSYIVPYVTYEATSEFEAQSLSIFGVGFWNALGAGAATAAAAAAAIVVIVLTNRVAIGIAAGALLGFGIQSFTDWVGIAGTAVTFEGHLALGAFLGLGASVVVFCGGLIALLSLFARRTA